MIENIQLFKRQMIIEKMQNHMIIVFLAKANKITKIQIKVFFTSQILKVNNNQ